MAEHDDAWWQEYLGVDPALWVCEPRGTGMPGLLLLHQFGAVVFEAFETYPWLVGSALTARTPHDIDVRLVLTGKDYERWCGGYGEAHPGTPWASLSLAYSALARQTTGLPVDFQIQRMTDANREHSDDERQPLGMFHDMRPHEPYPGGG